jgi:hypothetical protein
MDKSVLEGKETLVSGSEDDSNDQFFSLGERVSDTETESEEEESEMY